MNENPTETSEQAEPRDLNQPIALRKGVRECRNRPLYPMSNFISYERLSPRFHTFSLSLFKIEVPNSIQEALSIPEWKATMWEELRALQKNGIWVIADLPEGKTLVGCKWIFTVKYKSVGSVERFKARLVAKGYTQIIWD